MIALYHRDKVFANGLSPREFTTVINQKIMKSMSKLDDIRRENARQLSISVEGPANFARIVGMSDSRVSQIIGANFTRNIGNVAAAQIEAAFGKPDGWLSAEHTVEQLGTEKKDTPYPGAAPAALISVREAGDMPTLAYITAEENRLLSQYRVITNDEKNAVWSVLETAKHDESKIKLLKKITD